VVRLKAVLGQLVTRKKAEEGDGDDDDDNSDYDAKLGTDVSTSISTSTSTSTPAFTQSSPISVDGERFASV
jgi:hypothetical protein